MRVLVTGGAGFIGSHLVEQLLEQGHEVVCLDDFNDFYSPEIKKHNIEHALTQKCYTLVTGDILDRDLLDRVFAQSFDLVAHFAAYAGVRPSIERPDKYQRVNVEGTSNLLERCSRNGVRRFVFASSSSIYGGRTEVPFRESDDVMRPISPYAASKVAGEALCHTYHHLYGLNVHMLRLFTVYGPRQRPEMAIHMFAKHMLRGDPITVFGDGQMSRDYTYVDDIVDGVVASIERCSGFEVMNLGGSRTTTLERLVQLLSERLGIEPIVERKPDQLGDVPITYADVSRAKQVLGWEPKVGIEQGIDRFCTWLEERSAQRPSVEELAAP
jgi:UDP-glucuronate 4-epimerase